MTVQSTDQGQDEKVEVQSQDQGGQDQSQGQSVQEKVTVAGKEYDSLADLAKDYENLTKEFHKRNKEESPEVKEMKDTLKQLGVVTTEDLEDLKAQQASEAKLSTILSRNPDLASKEQEIRDLMALPSNQGKAVEDIIVKYNLKSKDKLVRAKTAGSFVGDTVPKDDGPQKYGEMSKEERYKYLDSLGKPDGFRLA